MEAIGAAGGLYVELDDSHCIVLRAPRNNGPDIILTVTDARGLADALDIARVTRDALEATWHCPLCAADVELHEKRDGYCLRCAEGSGNYRADRDKV